MSPRGSARRGRAVHRVLGAPSRPSPPPLDRGGADGPRSRSGRRAAGPRSTPMREGSGGSRAPLRRVPPLPFLGAEHRVQAPLREAMVYAAFDEDEDHVAFSVVGQLDFNAPLFVPKRAPCLQVQCFAELPVLLDEQFCKEQIKVYVSKKAVENPPFPEKQVKKICCADESYVCFARKMLLIYDFETVKTEDTWEHFLARFKDFKAVLFVPERDHFDLFDNIRL